MTESTLTLTCSGQAVDDFGRQVGEPCGAVLPRPRSGGWLLPPAVDGVIPYLAWNPLGEIDDAGYLNAARSAGWSVGPNREACCPKCRKPSAGVLRDVAAIERSIR